MATTKKLSIALTAELAAMVREAVASGGYASASEVIREALRSWSTAQAMASPSAVAAARALWDEGAESGPGRLGSIEAVKAEARRRRGDSPTGD